MADAPRPLTQREREIDLAWELHARAFYGQCTVRTSHALRTLAEAQNWRCCYCGCRMHEGGDKAGRATFEHVIPRAFGGADAVSNLVIACYPCNQQRGSEWRREHAEALAAMRNANG